MIITLQFEKIIIKFNKKKSKLFTNTKFKVFLYKTIALNIIFL